MIEDMNVVLTRQSLTDQIYDTLKNAIINGQLPEGAQLRQTEITRKFGSSQGPVREALLRLAGLGLVVIEPNRGARVAPPASDEEVTDLYLLRTLLESLAMQRFIEVASSDAKRALANHINSMKTALKNQDLPAFVEGDIAFHSHICDNSASETVYNLWQVINTKIRMTMARAHRDSSPDYLLGVVESHSEVLACILDNDTERAIETNERHLYGNWFKVKPEMKQFFERRIAAYLRWSEMSHRILNNLDSEGS